MTGAKKRKGERWGGGGGGGGGRERGRAGWISLEFRQEDKNNNVVHPVKLVIFSHHQSVLGSIVTLLNKFVSVYVCVCACVCVRVCVCVCVCARV